MTRERVRELLPIIQAYADGRTILIKHDGDWFESGENTEIYFSESPSDYRIKPEQKYRPFKSQEECCNEILKHQPLGWVVYKVTHDLIPIGGINNLQELTLTLYKNAALGMESAFNDYVFADGTPFGIKED